MSRAFREHLRKAGGTGALLVALQVSGLAVAGLAIPGLILQGAVSAAWAETEINARGWSHDTFGRLVLDSAAPLVKSAAIKDHKLVVEFSAPVSIRLGEALSKIGVYVERVADAKGTRLELTLLRPVTLHQFIDGDKYVLDLKRVDNWPAKETPPARAEASADEMAGSTGTSAAAAAPAKKATEATPPPAPAPSVAQAPAAPAPIATPPAVASSGSRIVVRQGEHPGYIRLAFDWPQKTDYRIERRDGMVVISFERAGAIDLGAVQKDVPGDLLQIAARDEGIARVYLTMAEGATLRDFRLGSTVVLDITRPAKKAAAAKPLTLPPVNAASTLAPAAEPPVAAPAAQPSTPPAAEPSAATATAESPATAPAATPAETSTAEPPSPPTLQLAPAAEPPAPVQQTQSASTAAEPSPPQPALQSLPDLPQAAPGHEAVAPTVPAAQPVLPEMPKVEQVQSPPRPPVDVQVLVAPAGEGAKITFTWPQPVAAAAFRHDGALYLAFDEPTNSLAALFADARIARLGQAAKIELPDSTVIRIVEAKPLGVSLAAAGRSWIVDIAPGAKAAPRAPIEQRRETLADGAASLLLTTSKPGRVVSLTVPGSSEQLQIVPVRPAGQGVAEEIAWPEFKLLATHQGVAVAGRAEAATIESLDQGVVVTTRPQGALSPIAEAPAPSEAAPAATAPAETPPAETPPEQAATGEGATGEHAAAEPAAPHSVEPGQAAEGGNGLTSVPGLFDLPTWRRGGEATFQTDQRQLEGAVTGASKSEKAQARLTLGEFYFAHGLLDEAEGALNAISAADAGKIDPREVRLLKAALQALHGDAEEAKASLADRDITELPETNLFLGLLAADAQDWPEAAKHFGGKLPNIGDYPKPVRDRLYVAGGQALANGGNPIGAQRFADALRQDQPDKEAADWLTYLDGLIKLKMGEREAGLALWETLSDSGDEEVKARSQMALVEERMQAGEMKPAEAITRLERLRFVNRGGDFEFNLLHKLGGLYIAEGQPRKGLTTLRGLAANFPDRPETKQVAEEMSGAFRNLYLENGADRLSPLVAVALYDEFRELTPAGADGDRMITMLADRLVKVDLLDRAASLLDSQVKKRLTGLDKAQAGTRLAAIYMLNQKPDQALQALKDSEIDEAMPPELIGERRRLEARATFDGGDTINGLQMLADDPSLEAKWLRADMLWRTREWPAAANALGELIDGEEQAQADEVAATKAKLDVTKDPAAAIDSDAQMAALRAKQDQHFKERIAPIILNRAIALSLASDRRGLRGLAKDFGDRMAGTDQEKAFTMLTAPDNGLVESVTAEMAGVDRIDAFVTDYREKLKAQSLSAPAPGGS